MRMSLMDVGAWFCCGALMLAFGGGAAAQTSDPPRPSRRVTNPVPGQRLPTPSDTTDLRIISTAEEEDAAAEARRAEEQDARPTRGRNNRNAAGGSGTSDERALRRTVDQLNRQVAQLSAQLGDMREQQRTLVNFERLSRAEQRAENYRAQLRDVIQREANLQARLDQIDIEILPENIQARAAGIGSLRSEQVREQMQSLLDKERTRVRSQLDLLAQSRTRLEQVIATADTEVARLNEQLNNEQTEQALRGDTPVETPLPPTVASPTNQAPPAEPTDAEPPQSML